MTKLDRLNLEKNKKFAEICELVACELGYRRLAAINRKTAGTSNVRRSNKSRSGKRPLSSERAPTFARLRRYDVC